MVEAQAEFAKSKGTISLEAVSASEQKALEDRRNQAAGQLIPISYAPFSMESSLEYQDEDNRVASIVKGFYVAGFWSAFLGALIVSIVSWIMTALISDSGKVAVITRRR